MKTSVQIITLTIMCMTMFGATSCRKHEGPTIAERKAERLQEYKDQLESERRTAFATDSLLQALLPRINEKASALFDYEKTEYDDLGHFTPKGMDPGQNVERTYLHSSVDEYGRTQLIATRYGSKGFAMTHIRLKGGDGTQVETTPVPVGADNNYQYDIDGTHYQTVTFVQSDALAYIASHADDAKLTYVMLTADGREQRGQLSAKERQALAATFELGAMLAESVRLQQENKTAAGKVLYLQEVVERKEKEQAEGK